MTNSTLFYDLYLYCTKNSIFYSDAALHGGSHCYCLPSPTTFDSFAENRDQVRAFIGWFVTKAIIVIYSLMDLNDSD